jgi:hypothetical protein
MDVESVPKCIVERLSPYAMIGATAEDGHIHNSRANFRLGIRYFQDESNGSIFN